MLKAQPINKPQAKKEKTMEITVYSKNNAVVYEMNNVEGAAPRIGETITLGPEYEAIDGIDTCLVVDVNHVLHNGALKTFVDCKCSVGALNRNLELKERGWLYTASDEF